MHALLSKLGIGEMNAGVFDGSWHGSGQVMVPISPVDDAPLGQVREATVAECEEAIELAQEAFLDWRETPAPVRGETVRRFGNALRAAKPDLARLITVEMGKILAEAEGEVQEMIEI